MEGNSCSTTGRRDDPCAQVLPHMYWHVGTGMPCWELAQLHARDVEGDKKAFNTIRHGTPEASCIIATSSEQRRRGRPEGSG